VKTFLLRRTVDVSGVSGTGAICEGVQFSDGVCALRWLTDHRSTAIYASMDDLVAIHGHDGATTVEWTP
jgi:hypothetical protein